MRNLLDHSEDSPVSNIFDTNLMGAVDCAQELCRHKMDFTGVKIAWVDIKSNKFP